MFRDNRKYLPVSVTLSKEHIGVVGSYRGRAVAVAKEVINDAIDQPKVKERMKDIEAVMNKIKWDPNENKEDWIIGYDDRFLGMLEQGYDEFAKSQTPIHRVRYFKKNGVIVWDRSTRVDNV